MAAAPCLMVAIQEKSHPTEFHVLHGFDQNELYRIQPLFWEMEGLE
jgi:hypothetical protein